MGEQSQGIRIDIGLALQLVEHLPGVHVVGVVFAAVPGRSITKFRLEVDLLMTVYQAGVPAHPAPSSSSWSPAPRCWGG